jgi:hypothetical protein
MKLSSTTFYGTTAAVCFGAAQAPGLPPWLNTAFNIGAAIGVAMLGRHAADCPKNCPGTDSQGQPRDDVRQIKLPIAGLSVLLLLLPLQPGCVTRNTSAVPQNPDAPAYIISPGLPAISNAAVQFAREAGNVSQTGPLLPLVVTGFFTAVAGISGLIAQSRSHKAALAKSTRPPPAALNSTVDTLPVNS